MLYDPVRHGVQREHGHSCAPPESPPHALMCPGQHYHHFPRIVQQLGGLAELSILERDPSEGDFPDSACEFIIPGQDFLFITGMTLTNKTLPRLLQIAGEKVQVSLVGPTSTASPVLFRYGVNNISGFVVTDPDYVKTVISEADRGLFNGGLMYNYRGTGEK